MERKLWCLTCFASILTKITFRHGGMRVNLVKAMMVFNWLNAVV
jgi:hypothetical protein